MREVARLIKEYRERIGISQAEIAKHFGFSTPMFVSNVERNISKWPVEKAKKLCEFLEIPKGKFVWAYKKDEEARLKKELDKIKRALGAA